MQYIMRKLFTKQCLIIFILICIFHVLLTTIAKPNRAPMDGYNMTIRETILSTFQDIQVEAETIVTPDEYLDINITSIAERMELRKKHLKETCSALGLDQIGSDPLHKPNSWEFLINYKYHLIWCNVFKSASTSWMYNFLILAGYSRKFLQDTNAILLNLAREKYPRPTVEELEQALNTSVSFLIVRHPLERILSTYREKLEGLPYNYLRKLGNEIAFKYRKKVPRVKQPLKNTVGPTFPEFIEYLLDAFERKLQLDMHWTPIVEFCTPCMWNFKIIAHTETLEEDQMHLIKLAQLEHILQPEWKNANQQATAQQDIIQKYYSQLPKTKIEQLYNIYRYDFELFNYTLDGYLQHGIEDDTKLMTDKITRNYKELF